MTMNPLPPQAYTKETMLKAYQWLQAQPSNIREMALTPDILVSLYLKASRDGEQSLDRPSIQNFKAELKSLAGLMGELDGPPAQAVAQEPLKMRATMPEMTSTSTTSQASAPPFTAPTFPPAPQVQSALQAQPASSHQIVVPSFTAPTPPSVESPTAATASVTMNATAPATPTAGLGVDAKSFEMLKEIKEDFNLSCEREALRMLIKIGFCKAKTLLK